MPSTHPQISQIPDPHRLQYVFMGRSFRGPRNPGYVFFDGNPLNLSQPKPGVLARNLAKSMPKLYKLVPIDPKTGVPTDPDLRKAWLQHLIKEHKPLENGQPATSVPLEAPAEQDQPETAAALAEPPGARPAAPEQEQHTVPAADPRPSGEPPATAADGDLGEAEEEEPEGAADDGVDGEQEGEETEDKSGEQEGGGAPADPKAQPPRLSKKQKKQQRKKAVTSAPKDESAEAAAAAQQSPQPPADTLPAPRQRQLPTTHGQAAFAAALAAESRS
jgi:hypothetical protein